MAGVLLDRFGNPIKANVKALETEEAAPMAGTTRAPTFDPVASGLRPDTLAKILADAVTDDPADFFAVAEEMEERDLHYGAVLGTRKRAVTKLAMTVEPVDDSAQERKIAEAVGTLIAAPGFRRMRKAMMDALGKGISVVEMQWGAIGGLQQPVGYTWRDPRFFSFDEQTRSRLLLKDGDNLKELTSGKYVVHAADTKSGLPIRGGLARMAAWCFIMKTYTLKDWAAFAEIFGMPLRVGRYHARASEDDKRRLLRAVLSIAADAGAIIPEGMQIEFIKSEAGRGEAVFGALADYLDKQVSKGVLGQTMTTDDGSSLAQAEVHDEVRADIRDDDALDADETIQRDVINQFVALNFGVRPSYPQVKALIPEPEDIAALTTALGTLVPQGLKVKQAEVRDKLGLSHPEDGDELLAPVSTTMMQDVPAPGRPAVAANRLSRSRLAAMRPDDDIDQIMVEELADWEQTLGPVVKPLIEAAEQAGSYGAFLERLDALMAADDSADAQLIGSLARAMAKARINGLADG